MKNIHLPALTSLRFFAALMVFFSHMNQIRAFPGSNGDPLYYEKFYHTWFYEGFVGVTFFFILSGFILSHSYQDRMANGKTSAGDFYIYRIARIFPLHWLTLGVAMYCMHKYFPTTPFFSLESFLANAFLLQAFINRHDITNSYNAVSWSLSVELLFYALFPLLVRLRSGWLLALLALQVSLVLAWLPVQLPFAPFHLPAYTDQSKFYAYFFPPARLGDFLAGILLYRVWRARTVLSAGLASALQIAAVATLTLFFLLHRGVNEIYRFDLYYVLPMGLVIYAFAYQNGWLARLLSLRVLVILGEASFAFYMVHQLVINFKIGTPIFNHYPSWLSLYFTPAGYISFNLVVSLLLSLLLFYLFERPVQRLGNTALFALRRSFTRLLRRPQPQAAA